ncbi:hypothetical protein AcV7_010038 [Taiwanofungus camphoratus]|nr:hypothetical protein AcV7_010038 [Antrodia cinnamomea]
MKPLVCITTLVAVLYVSGTANAQLVPPAPPVPSPPAASSALVASPSPIVSSALVASSASVLSSASVASSAPASVESSASNASSAPVSSSASVGPSASMPSTIFVSSTASPTSSVPIASSIVTSSVVASSASASFTRVSPTAEPSYNSGSGTEAGWPTLSIPSYTFSSYPVASASPIPSVFPLAYPANPPPVSNAGSPIVPDFSQAWADAYVRAEAFVGGLGLEEKVDVTTGVGYEAGLCVGNVGQVAGWPGLCLQDSPLGVRDTNFNTAFPAGISVAATCVPSPPSSLFSISAFHPFFSHSFLHVLASLGALAGSSPPTISCHISHTPFFPLHVLTFALRLFLPCPLDRPKERELNSTRICRFNRTAMRLRGLYMGREHRGKGVNVALGPMMNMGRVAQAGRNWEGFGTDAFLSGEAAYETVLGVQQAGVQACAKHYIDYEQEYKRLQESSNVDDRTNHEIYLKPFLRSVMAGVASVMCSYNMINYTFACENDRTLNQLLKSELGFRGYVMSDWFAQRSPLSAAAGLDMTMPGPLIPGLGWGWGANLTALVLDGILPESRVDDMATRVLAGYYFLGQENNYPNVSFDANDPTSPANLDVDVEDDHYRLVREIGAQGAVLLKNTDGALPLNAPRSLVLVGSDAGDAAMGPNGYVDRGGDDGVLGMGWGSGTANYPYLVSPLDAIQERAAQDGSAVSWWLQDFDTEGAMGAVVGFDVAIVFVNADSGEGYITVDGNEGDRNNLTLWHNADNLIQAVAAMNNNTIVVAHSVGPSIIEPWVENPNVTALIWAGVPGQEAGNSITDVLYGAYNPSGRLPYTIAKTLEDYGTVLTLSAGLIISVPYTEGIFYDYRRFDEYDITPRYEFGFGLSYTTFAYYDLTTTVLPQYDPSYVSYEASWAAGLPTPQGEGSSTAIWLHRPFVQVQFEVQNTGAVAGTEIPQLYVHFPTGSGEPPSLLKGFDSVYLEPGETQTVILTVPRYELSIWDVISQSWIKPSGLFTLSVGASSRDFRLNGTIPI